MQQETIALAEKPRWPNIAPTALRKISVALLTPSRRVTDKDITTEDFVSNLVIEPLVGSPYLRWSYKGTDL